MFLLLFVSGTLQFYKNVCFCCSLYPGRCSLTKMYVFVALCIRDAAVLKNVCTCCFLYPGRCSLTKMYFVGAFCIRGLINWYNLFYNWMVWIQRPRYDQIFLNLTANLYPRRGWMTLAKIVEHFFWKLKGSKIHLLYNLDLISSSGLPYITFCESVYLSLRFT